jgi:hypothetical protein
MNGNPVKFGDFDGDIEFTKQDVIIVPSDFVDGVHATQVMTNDRFPLKIMVHSTGQILYIYGFRNNGAVYSSVFNEGGVCAEMRGVYFGKVGKDFLYL